MKTNRTIQILSRQVMVGVGRLLGAATLFSGCSQDEGSGPDDGERVAVEFTASTQTATPQNAAQVHSSGTMPARSGLNAAGAGNLTITGRGVTSAGLEYIEYDAGDGFTTREVMPPAASGAALRNGSQERGMPQTRTTTGGTEWTGSDQVGIFMLKTGGSLGNSGDLLTDNKKYVATPGNDAKTATFTPDGGTPIYYPQTGNVDFVAYYPWRTTPGSEPYIYKVSVADQSDPAKIDVLYSNNVTNKARSKTDPAALEFDHALSKLILNVKAGEGITPDDITALTAGDVSINSLPVTADLALADGSVTPTGTPTAFSPLKVTKAANFDATFEAILIPQAAGAYTGRTVVFTVGGTDYTWTIGDGIAFEQGKSHTYEITVKKSGIDASGGTITPWTGTGTTTPGTAELLPIETVKIKAGTFQMGSPESEPGHFVDEVQHEVTLTQDFWMGKYQVTGEQYAAFLNAVGVAGVAVGSTATHTVSGYGERPLFTVNEGGWTPKWNAATSRWESSGAGAMIYVTWYGAKAYADWVGGFLPTEAQWEYACRAGTTTAYSFGDDTGMLGDYGWYSTHGLSGPKDVGLKLPNPWGLYDMHGNVSEWCSDRYGTYSDSPATNPTGPDTGNDRVLRGGSWNSLAQNCRSAYRYLNAPGNASSYNGFRVGFVP